MRIDRGIVLSVAGHGAFLVWALISFARPLETRPLDSMPVDIITADEFTRMTAGADKAPQQPEPKPLVEKVAEAETKPVEDISAKVVEKKEVTASTSEQTPEPKPKQPDPKPAAAPPEPKTEAKAPDKKEPEQKVDPIAEALKKDDAKKPDKKAETKPQPVKKPDPQPPKFDPRKVEALINKRDPTRLAAAGSSLNSMPALGAPKGAAKQLSMSELDALRKKLRDNWSPPAGASPDMEVRIFITLRRDGTLAGAPQVQTSGTGGVYATLRESVVRAIYASQPFSMLRPETYEIWHELDATFTPRDFM